MLGEMRGGDARTVGIDEPRADAQLKEPIYCVEGINYIDIAIKWSRYMKYVQCKHYP